MSNKYKVIRVCAKTKDLFAASFLDESGETIADYDGYTPKFFPDDHYGDYIMLDIELSTGKILNWEAPSEQDIEEALKEGGY